MAPPPLLPVAASTPILHGEFGSYPANGPRFALTLTTQALHIQRLRPKPEARPRDGLVSLDEVSGCGTLQSRSPEDTAAYFCIYTYPRGRRGGRRRATRTFRADGATTYEENRAEASAGPLPSRVSSEECLCQGTRKSPLNCCPGSPGCSYWSIPLGGGAWPGSAVWTTWCQ